MKNINLNVGAVAIAIGLVFSTHASADALSKDQYKASEKTIESDFKAAKASCDSLSGNAKDVCMEQAKGKQKVAKANLEFQFKPTTKTQYEARVAMADAEFAVAKEKCDDKAGNVKDVCVTEAKAAHTRALADAKADMKTAKAESSANEKATDANNDAKSDIRDADYAVAKEKCDSLAGDTKDRCLSAAKARFGK